MSEDRSLSPAVVDREMIVAHLRDIRTLYAARDALELEEGRLEELEQSWSQRRHEEYSGPPRPIGPWKPPAPELAEESPTYRLFFHLLLGLARALVGFILGAFFVLMIAYAGGSSFPLAAVLIVLAVVCVAAGVLAGLYLNSASDGDIEQYEHKYEDYERKLPIYLEELRTFESRSKAWSDRKRHERADALDRAQRRLLSTRQEMESATALLDRTYGINLIPAQFRTKNAIHFLYEYVSTSQEGLSSALLHCDLEQIKQLVAEVIEQQDGILLRQEMALALLHGTLDTLRDIRSQESALFEEAKRLSSTLKKAADEQTTQLSYIRHYSEISTRHSERLNYLTETRVLPELVELNR